MTTAPAARATARVRAGAVVCLVLLAGCSGGGDERDGGGPADASSAPVRGSSDEGPVPAGGQDVATGLEAPWSVAFLGDTALVSARDAGEVRELLGDGSTRVVGTVEGVDAAGEGGLLGIVVDDQRRLFAYSTSAEGNRIERYELSGEPGSLALGEPEVVLEGIPAGGIHNGGRLALGPDGMLYATTGDGGESSVAQDPRSLGGKILRMTPDGRVPDDNPTPGSLVWSMGHRNVQGIGWAEDGTMYASEFGQSTWDELNRIEPGANYGWPEVEGTSGDGGEGFTDPIAQFEPAEASPSGILVRDGRVLMAGLRGESLRAVPVDSPGEARVVLEGLGRLRDVVAAPDGAVWVVTNNTDGRGSPRDGDDRIVRVDLPGG